MIRKTLTYLRGMPLENKLGWAGVVFLQGATLPSMVATLRGVAGATLPPLSLVFMVWTGLLLYFYRAYLQRDVVYMTSNGIGLVLNSILLALIVFPRY